MRICLSNKVRNVEYKHKEISTFNNTIKSHLIDKAIHTDPNRLYNKWTQTLDKKDLLPLMFTKSTQTVGNSKIVDCEPVNIVSVTF